MVGLLTQGLLCLAFPILLYFKKISNKNFLFAAQNKFCDSQTTQKNRHKKIFFQTKENPLAEQQQIVIEQQHIYLYHSWAALVQVLKAKKMKMTTF